MFGGGGSIQGMQTSLRNNRIFLKKKNRFRERAKEIKTHHIESHRVRKFSRTEMSRFKKKLLTQRKSENRAYVVIGAVMVSILITIIAIVNGLAIF